LLFTCLFAATGVDLKSIIRERKKGSEFLTINQENQIKNDLIECIYNVWSTRKDRYSELRAYSYEKPQRRKIEMSYIGG
jgi:cyclic pyranopterin phosphate synthase